VLLNDWVLSRSDNAGAMVVLKPSGPETVSGCVVPLHAELAIRTLRGILKQAGITPDEFIASL